jgi:hypothetical protein
MKAYGGVDVQIRVFLILALVGFAPVALPQGKVPRYPFGRRIGGFRSRPGSNFDPSAALPTALPRPCSLSELTASCNLALHSDEKCSSERFAGPCEAVW